MKPNPAKHLRGCRSTETQVIQATKNYQRSNLARESQGPLPSCYLRRGHQWQVPRVNKLFFSSSSPPIVKFWHHFDSWTSRKTWLPGNYDFPESVTSKNMWLLCLVPSRKISFYQEPQLLGKCHLPGNVHSSWDMWLPGICDFPGNATSWEI